MPFTASSHPLGPLVAEARSLLGDLRDLLVRAGGHPESLATLRQALADLDYLFLLVVAGEFNAGKSALINALLGAHILREGVTPTTAAVTLITYGDTADQVDRNDGLLEVRYPLPLLRDVVVVDTPGTNAVLREHEVLTQRFVPRADLVLFVTSADRPFTESERAFLEHIREWGKKIVVVLNKVDLLMDEAELETQQSFIREGAQRLLGLDPPLWPVSARLARLAEVEQDAERKAELRRSSGLDALVAFLETTLEESGRLRLKLLSATGVAERLLAEYRQALDSRLAVLAEDRKTAMAIERYLVQHSESLRSEFEYRLDRLDRVLRDMADRGTRFIEENIRLGRVFDLFNAEKMRGDFEREVVADVPQRIDDLAQELIDWLVDQDQRLWYWLSQQLQRRADSSATPLPGRFEVPFAEDRRAVLQALVRAARDVLRRHDYRRQAEQFASSVRATVTRTTLVEAGALGLGALTVAILGSVAADVTGLLAASAMAGLGLYLLPLRRRRAEQQLRARTAELRETLAAALRKEFSHSLELSLKRVRGALAPYDEFLAVEQRRIEIEADQLQGIAAGLAKLRRAVDAGAS